VERAKVVKEEVQQQGINFLAVYGSLKITMIMLSEKEDKGAP
jgi:hypothetical protein